MYLQRALPITGSIPNHELITYVVPHGVWDSISVFGSILINVNYLLSFFSDDVFSYANDSALLNEVFFMSRILILSILQKYGQNSQS